MVMLADAKTKCASMLMPAQKMVMEMPASMTDQKMMTCSTDDVDGCLKAKGYKKTGSETWTAIRARFTRGTRATADESASKVWRPTDMKEVYMVKSLIDDSRGP